MRSSCRGRRPTADSNSFEFLILRGGLRKPRGDANEEKRYAVKHIVHEHLLGSFVTILRCPSNPKTEGPGRVEARDRVRARVAHPSSNLDRGTTKNQLIDLGVFRRISLYAA